MSTNNTHSPKYLNDPISFIEKCMGIRLNNFQTDYISKYFTKDGLFSKENNIYIQSCRQSGYTTVNIGIIMYLLISHKNVDILLLGHDYRLMKRLIDEYIFYLPKQIKPDIIESNKSFIKLRCGNRLSFSYNTNIKYSHVFIDDAKPNKVKEIDDITHFSTMISHDTRFIIKHSFENIYKLDKHNIMCLFISNNSGLTPHKLESISGYVESLGYDDTMVMLYDIIQRSTTYTTLLFSSIKEFKDTYNKITEHFKSTDNISIIHDLSGPRKLIFSNEMHVFFEVANKDIGLYGNNYVLFHSDTYDKNILSELLRSLKPVYESSGGKICICSVGKAT